MRPIIERPGLIQKVELSGSCYYNMIRSIVESWKKEAAGYLFGRFEGRKAIMINAYPLLTTKRTKNYVSYDIKHKPIRRLRSLDKAISRNGDSDTGLIGGFHSHIVEKGYETRPLNDLSKEDKNFIIDEMRELDNKDEEEFCNTWIEIILRINARKYSRREIGETITEFDRKLGITIRDSVDHGYRMVITGYRLTRDNERTKKVKASELKVRNRRVKVIPRR